MKIWIASALLAVILSLGGVGYWQISRLENTVFQLTQRNAELRVQVEQEKANTDQALAQVRGAVETVNTFRQNLEKLEESDEEAKSEMRKINEILSKRDIGELANKRPVLVERRINDGSDRIVRLLECASRVADKNCDGADRNGKADQSP